MIDVKGIQKPVDDGEMNRHRANLADLEVTCHFRVSWNDWGRMALDVELGESTVAVMTAQDETDERKLPCDILLKNAAPNQQLDAGPFEVIHTGFCWLSNAPEEYSYGVQLNGRATDYKEVQTPYALTPTASAATTAPSATTPR